MNHKTQDCNRLTQCVFSGDMIDVVIDLSDIYGLTPEERAACQDQTAFDNQSSSLIKLNNNTILYLKEVNKFLALVCILREENFIRQGSVC
jgi:Ras-related GTP-binding protein C/D